MPHHFGVVVRTIDMATPIAAIRQIILARREQQPPPPKNLQSYRPIYREILETVHEIGGEPVVDMLTEWIIEETKSTGELPPPTAVITHARKIINELEAEIPEDSVLQAT